MYKLVQAGGTAKTTMRQRWPCYRAAPALGSFGEHGLDDHAPDGRNRPLQTAALAETTALPFQTQPSARRAITNFRQAESCASHEEHSKGDERDCRA